LDRNQTDSHRSKPNSRDLIKERTVLPFIAASP